VIRVPVKPRREPAQAYDIRIGRGLAPRLTVDLRKRKAARHYIIVTDDHLRAAMGAPLLAAFRRRGLSVDLISFPSGEGSKSRRVRDEIEDGILALGAGRDAALVALGGGVVGDLTGFVAATYCRGIPYVQVPTSLIAMVDSSIGGKTGINHPAGKNLIGAFHNPIAVYIDVDHLKALPPRHFTSGMAEVVKCGVIADAVLFHALETYLDRVLRREPETLARIIEACVRIKVRVVDRDPRESGVRKILNFGHTIGHALETLSGFRLTHGEAVGIGMAVEARIAVKTGLLSDEAAERVIRLTARCGLPTTVPQALGPAAILEVARRDKKTRQGRIAYALPKRIGAMASRAGEYGILVDDALVAGVLQDLRRPKSRPRALTVPLAR